MIKNMLLRARAPAVITVIALVFDFAVFKNGGSDSVIIRIAGDAAIGCWLYNSGMAIAAAGAIGVIYPCLIWIVPYFLGHSADWVLYCQPLVTLIMIIVSAYSTTEEQQKRHRKTDEEFSDPADSTDYSWGRYEERQRSYEQNHQRHAEKNNDEHRRSYSSGYSQHSDQSSQNRRSSYSQSGQNGNANQQNQNSWHNEYRRSSSSQGSASAANDSMTFSEAQKIFQLPLPYTARELKKRRNELIQKYHPDHGGTNEEAVMIQKAYEELKRYATG